MEVSFSTSYIALMIHAYDSMNFKVSDALSFLRLFVVNHVLSLSTMIQECSTKQGLDSSFPCVFVNTNIK